MEVFHKTALLAERIATLRAYGSTIGFVPTMGALHAGHLSLIRTCAQQNDIPVASIFVNPTQFNDKRDLERYPRMPERDMDLLQSAGCQLVFLPDEHEVYPEPDTREFDFGGLDRNMEGKQRPGHFRGVAQVVTRLFDIVTPHRAYFGLKDFQQLAIIRKVTADLGYPVEIIPCPIVRESDGLAMSSRNMLLSPEERRAACILSAALFEARSMKEQHTPAEVKQFVEGMIRDAPLVALEYFEIVDAGSLQPVTNWTNEETVGCLAASVGKIRLIDNVNFSL
jgi:pantoate--beta-alanine ligase